MTWPTLQIHGWQETRATMHMWTQIVGKTRLALAPFQNHWWHVPLYLSSRGLTTSAVPWRDQTLELEFDLVRHVLELRSSLGQTAAIPLASRPVAHFFRDYLELLESFNVRAKFLKRPVEVRESLYFEQDFKHRTYDPEWANALWRVLMHTRNVFEQFRGEFVGKASPVHFFWGSFDLAASRFSGRPAPRHPGGAPNCANYVMEEAYSHEVSSAGFLARRRDVPALWRTRRRSFSSFSAAHTWLPPRWGGGIARRWNELRFRHRKKGRRRFTVEPGAMQRVPTRMRWRRSGETGAERGPGAAALRPARSP